MPVRFKNKNTAAVREEALDSLFKGVPIAKEMVKSEDKDTTWGKLPAKEMVFEAPNPPEGKKPRVVVRRLATDTAAYIGYVKDNGELTPQEVTAFFDSFELLPRPAPK